MTPDISVIVCVFDSAPFLDACLQSLRAQTFTNFEVLLMDGGSQDHSVDVCLEASRQDPRFRFFPSPTRVPVAVCRSQALKAAQGKYVAVLDSDDIAKPRRFEKQWQWLEQHPDVVILGSNRSIMDENGRLLRRRTLMPNEDLEIRWRVAFGNVFCHSTVMFRTQAGRATGGYDPVIVAGEDMEFFSRLLLQGRAALLPDVLVSWRKYSSSLSNAEPAKTTDAFLTTLQSSILRHTGLRVERDVAATLFNDSLAPALSLESFRAALDVVEKSSSHFSGRAVTSRDKKLLGRVVFLQLLDLFKRNRTQPWWPQVEQEWVRLTQQLVGRNPTYHWLKDPELLWHIKKLYTARTVLPQLVRV